MKLLLHSSTQRQLDQAVATPAGTYLFHGGEGRGKRAAALELTRRLNCAGEDDASCRDCRLITAGSHPQLIVVQPGDKARLGIEAARQLHGDMTLKSYGARGRRVVIVDAAETLTPEAQNALLKLIEEPPLATTIVLVATTPSRLLATVKSRAQAVYFPELPHAVVASYLEGQGIKPSLAAEATALAGGATGRAVVLAADESAREELRQLTATGEALLSGTTYQRLLLARQIAESKQPLEPLIQLLERRLRQGLRQTGVDTALALTRLEAVSRFWSRLNANVTPRLALESLTLELSS